MNTDAVALAFAILATLSAVALIAVLLWPSKRKDDFHVTTPFPLGRSTVVSASGSNPDDLGSNPSAPAIHVDDATGKPVHGDWWPGDPI